MVAKSKTAMTSTEDVADLARMWDELETTFKRKEMVLEAETRLNENINVTEIYGNGDARQVMVSTDGKTLHGNNRGLGWRSFEVGGSMSEAALQEDVRSMSSLRDQHHSHEEPRQQRKVAARNGDVAEGIGMSKFRDQYGQGFQLSHASAVDKTQGSADVMESGSNTTKL